MATIGLGSLDSLDVQKRPVSDNFCSAADIDFVGIINILENTVQVQYTVQHSTVQYSTVQYSTAQYSIVQHRTVQYSTEQYSTVQHSTAQKSTVQYSTVQHSTAQYSTAQHSTAQHSTVQYGTVHVPYKGCKTKTTRNTSNCVKTSRKVMMRTMQGNTTQAHPV